jgi:glycosyltransferase involved in cell wall biosynthesis
MHVLFVHGDRNLGGVGRSAQQLATGLRERGWTVEHLHVAAGSGSEVAGRITALARRRGVVLATDNFSAAYAAALIAGLCRRPWVMWVHGPVLDVLQMAGTRPLKRRFLRWFYRRAPVAVFSSAATRDSFIGFCEPREAQQHRVIRNTAATAFFAPAPAPGPAHPMVDVGYLGRLSSEKQPLQLIRMLDFLPSSYRLHIVGDGPLHNEVAAAGAQGIAKGRLVLHGQEVASAKTYQQWQATVLCSAYEGYPLTLLESLAGGVPVVSTPIAAAVEMLAPHAPYMLARDHEPQSLARAVESTLSRSPQQVAEDIESINRAHRPAVFLDEWHLLLASMLGR